VLDLNVEEVSLSYVEVEVLYKGFTNHWELLRARDSKNYQYSRVDCLRDGDANLDLFHANIKMRRWQNPILVLKVRHRWVENVDNI
jgi:hypothetical protein